MSRLIFNLAGLMLIVSANQDTMDTWDEEKLRKVVLSKHGNPRTTTDVSWISVPKLF